MINIKEILEKHQSEVSKERFGGNKLVTGHSKSTFDEAAIRAISEIVGLTLDLVVEDVTILVGKLGVADFYYSEHKDCNSFDLDNAVRVKINEESIKNVIKQLKI